MGVVIGLTWGRGSVNGGMLPEGPVAGLTWGQEMEVDPEILKASTAAKSWHGSGAWSSDWKGPGPVLGTRWSTRLGTKSWGWSLGPESHI